MFSTSVQFTVAAHLWRPLAFHPRKEIHSAFLAENVNTDPGLVGKSLSKLSKAGLVSTSRGKNGASKPPRSPKKFTVPDIYRASSAPPTFAVHSYLEKKICPVSAGIKGCMSRVLAEAQGSSERALAKITAANVVKRLKK